MTGLVVYEHARNQYIRALTLMFTFLMLAACMCTPTFAGPQGGDVVGGLAQITRPDAVTTNITQATEKAIINWDGFNIDVNELVKFVQPGANAVALNRVTGADPSTILGQLLANGRIFLVNPNGVVFGPGSKVDVGSLIATTFDLKNDDFLSGNYGFLQKAGKDPSYIINKGKIKVADNGFVFLVAPGVKNEGLIIANIGKVVLGSGDKFAVDFRGDGLITYEISGKVIDKVKGPDGAPLTSAVSNTGTISNRGGEVVLTGDAASEVVSSVINQEGVIEAKSLVSEGGSVKLVGGDEGIVKNRGKIDVSADETGAKPGEVSISGNYVGNFGTILAKGVEEAKGGNVTLNSTTQTLNSTSGVIDVSGSVDSDGGSILLLSSNNTTDNGKLLARGGDLSGDGGFIELSSLGGLSFTGQVDTWAPFGRTGTLLIDPKYVYIHGSSAIPLADVDQFTDAPGSHTFIAAATINAAAANVTIQANSDIVVGDAVDIAAPGVGLTMQAGKRVIIVDNITTNDGAVSITANDSGADTSNRDTGDGNILMTSYYTIDAGNAPITLMVDGNGVTPGTIDTGNLVASDVVVSSVGNLRLNGSITAQDLVSLESTSGNIGGFDGSINATNLLVKAATGFGSMITAVDNFAVDGGTGDVFIWNSKALNFTTIGSTTGVSTAGNILIYAPTINLKANDLTQTGAGYILLGSHVVLADDVNLSATNSAIAIDGTIDSDATPRSLTLNSTGLVRVTGAIGATSALSGLTVTGSNIGLNDIGGATAGVTGVTSVTAAPTGSINFYGINYNAHQQTYNSDTITLDGGGNKTFTSANNPVSFMGQVDLNGFDLTASTGSGTITFNETVDGSGNLVVNTTGDTVFNDRIGNSDLLSSLTTDAGGRTIINGELVATQGAQTYGDSITLAAPATTFTSIGDADIAFNNRVSGSSNNMTVNTAGTTTFRGGVAELTSLTTDAGGTTAINGVVATQGTQTYGDDVILGMMTTYISSGVDGGITFNGKLDGTSELRVNTAGVTTFNDAVGGTTPLTGIWRDGSGVTAINGGSVTTTGYQIYNGSVTLGTPATTFTSTGNMNILFLNTLNGASELTVNTAGLVAFAKSVGDISALASITTNSDGSISMGASEINTTGAQTYGGPVYIGDDIAFNSDTGDISFASTIDGEHALSVNTDGAASFGGIIGGVTPVTTLDVTAGSDVTMAFDATTSVSVNTSSANGDIRLASLTGDIPLGVFNAGTGMVTLTAAKAIIDINGTANNILSPSIALRATTGIGTVADPIESQGITTLAASTSTGDVCLTNTGALTVGAIDGLTGVGITSSESTGDIALTANGGNITLTAADEVDQNEDISNNGTGDVSVTAGTGSITMGSGAGTTAANGNVTYIAQDNISVNEIITATIGPDGNVTLTTLDGDVIDLNGAAPNITANNVTISTIGGVFGMNNYGFLQGLINTGCLPDVVIINNRILFGTMMHELLQATSPFNFHIFCRYRGFSDELL